MAHHLRKQPEAVSPWLDAISPVIEQRSKAKCGGIHRGDEAALVNTSLRDSGYASRGPISVAMPVGSTREKLSMI